VERRALADDARRRHARLDERGQRRVDVDLAPGPPRRPERDQRRGLGRQLGDGPAEELGVARVGLRVAALDPAHAQPVELLGDPQLVVDRERDALELGAVAQRRVEDVDVLGEGDRRARGAGRGG
jgi:hypothetical protein